MDEQELEKIRDVRIHSLLHIKDDGRRRNVQCPFHNDRTPSCSIYPDNSYHCFACDAHGSNAIDFVMGLGASFQEAVEELSKHV